jgi:predicted nucleotidyltransferase
MYEAIEMDILELLNTHESEIKELFSVKRIGVFGSYARTESTPESDVDIIVEFKKSTFSNLMGLAFLH